ncbi:MAG: response regulator [Halobacteriovoraceae bacterium]|jgi:YesN/AraC family two-component response regulator|nr:response regulator [Halobacteriovoraceae bacterium]
MHKILICEDEPELLETLEQLIEIKLTSCEIVKAMNGLDGFIAAQKEKFDLILTDHKMPFMSGAALVIGIRTRETKNKETPMIMLSAHIDEEMRKNLSIQNVQFLEKPLSPDDFIDVIRTYLI